MTSNVMDRAVHTLVLVQGIESRAPGKKINSFLRPSCAEALASLAGRSWERLIPVQWQKLGQGLLAACPLMKEAWDILTLCPSPRLPTGST